MDKYKKYKTKYLELKKLLKHIQRGGVMNYTFNSATPVSMFYDMMHPKNINIDINNIHELFNNNQYSAWIQQQDAQKSNYTTNVRGFYYPGKLDIVDNVYRVPNFGNFWDTNIQNLKLRIDQSILNSPTQTLTFTNAEAMFQAFKYLYLYYVYTNNMTQNIGINTPIQQMIPIQSMTGAQAYNYAKQLTTQLQQTNWHSIKYSIMYLCLSSKYGYLNNRGIMKMNQLEFTMLLNTNDAYLMEFTPNNSEWGFDYNKGDGNNWLGRLLMIKRKELGGIGIPGGNMYGYYIEIFKAVNSQYASIINTIIRKLQWKSTNSNQQYKIIKLYKTQKGEIAIMLNIHINDPSFITHLKQTLNVNIYPNKLNMIYL